MSRRALTLIVAATALVILGVVGSVLPVPYVALQPGPITNTLGNEPGTDQPLIVVKGHPTYPTEGTLALTTVSVVGDPRHQPTLFSALADWFDRDTAVVPEQLIFPPGENVDQVQQENAQEMQQSQENAVTAALTYLHIPVKTVVAVGEITKSAPAAEVLKTGDVIESIDGQPITSEKQLRTIITGHQPGDVLKLTIKRDGKTLQQAVTTTVAGTGAQRRTVVGFAPVVKHDFPFSVDIRLQDVGGPSAGTMFALGLIDKLTPGSLTGGRFVAGTGTIDTDGTVGPIGGVQQKVVAAARAGAKVFLVPAGDCAGARSTAPDGVRLVRITTLAGAVQALEDLGTHPDRVPHC